jgi:hypothetical protein
VTAPIDAPDPATGDSAAGVGPIPCAIVALNSNPGMARQAITDLMFYTNICSLVKVSAPEMNVISARSLKSRGKPWHGGRWLPGYLNEWVWKWNHRANDEAMFRSLIAHSATNDSRRAIVEDMNAAAISRSYQLPPPPPVRPPVGSR